MLLFLSLGIAPYQILGEETETLKTQLKFETTEDTSVFELHGHWKLDLLSSAALDFKPGKPSLSWQEPLLFTQDVNLSLEALIDERWHIAVEADDSAYLKAFALGYLGAKDEKLKSLVIGNALPAFPTYPYTERLGDTILGFYAAFANHDSSITSSFDKIDKPSWSFQGLAQLESDTLKEKTYRGAREIFTLKLSLKERYRAKAFVLPDEALTSHPEVYVETAEGEYLSSDGRSFRRLNGGEFAASRALGLLELAQPATSLLAIYYEKDGERPWDSSMGYYRNAEEEAGPGFLGATQALFDEGTRIDLAEYPQCGGGDGLPATININGKSALVLFEPGSFSPFERADLYKAPAGFSAEDASLVNAAGLELEAYTADRFDSLYIDDDTALTSIRSRELVSPRSPSRRFPLAAVYPSAYLPAFPEASDSALLVFHGAGAAAVYDIGPRAKPSSIRVYRDGFPEYNFLYDSSSGIVSLSQPAESWEQLRIVYSETGDTILEAAGLSAAIGGSVQSGALSFRTGGAYRLALDKSGPQLPGYFELGAALDYKEGDDISEFASVSSLGFAIGGRDAFVRVAGMEDTLFPLTLLETSASPSQTPSLFPTLTPATRAALVYRDVRRYDLFGSWVLGGLDDEGKIINDREGPYAVAALAKTALVAEFQLTDEKFWTGYQVPLGEDAKTLENAEELTLTLRCMDLIGDGAFRVFLQIGALSDPSSGLRESDWLILTKQVLDSTNPAVTSMDWTTLSIKLDDQDRKRLSSARSLRLFIIRDQGTISGRMAFAPPQRGGSSYTPSIMKEGNIVAAAGSSSLIKVSVLEREDASLSAAFPLEISHIHDSSRPQRILELSWKDAGLGESPAADGRITMPPLSSYRSLVFYIHPPAQSSGKLRFYLSPSTNIKEAWLELVLPLPALPVKRWSQVRVDYGGSSPKVFINGGPSTEASLFYKPPTLEDERETASSLIVMEAPATTALADGSLYIDEIHITEAVISPLFSLGQSLEWRHKGVLWTLGDLDLVSDPSASFNLEGKWKPESAGIDITNGFSSIYKLMSAARLKATLLSLNLDLNTAISVNNQGIASWKAGHRLSLPFERLELLESYTYDPSLRSSTHRAALETKGAVGFRLSTERLVEQQNDKRVWEASFSAYKFLREDIAPPLPEVFMKTNAAEEKDKLSLTHQDRLYIEANSTLLYASSKTDDWRAFYPEAWLESWESLIPYLGLNERERDIKASFSAGFNAKAWSFGFQTKAEFSTIKNDTRETKFTADLSLPLNLGSSTLSVKARRAFDARENETSGLSQTDLIHDLSAYADTSKDAIPALFGFPSFILNDPAQPEALRSFAATRVSAALSDRVGLEWTTKTRKDGFALLVPVSATLGLRRSIAQKLDNHTDSVALNAAARFSVLNLFGAFGVTPLTRFYDFDEFYHYYESELSFIHEKPLAYSFLCGHDALFHASSFNLTVSNAIRLSDQLWSEHIALSLTAKASHSLIAALYRAALDQLSARQGAGGPLPSLAALPFSAERRGGVDFNISNSKGVVWDLGLSYRTSVKTEERVSIAAFLELGFSGGTNRFLTLDSLIGLTAQLFF